MLVIQNIKVVFICSVELNVNQAADARYTMPLQFTGSAEREKKCTFKAPNVCYLLKPGNLFHKCQIMNCLQHWAVVLRTPGAFINANLAPSAHRGLLVIPKL